MKHLLPLVLLAPLACSVSAQDHPVPAAEAPGKMTVPKGFQVTLFAGEPDVVQPIAFTFDDRGRLWVVECLSYPHWKLDGTGNDRVVMFEDTNGDGHFDVRHVVYDKGSNLSGIELGHGGIWLCSTPNLVFLPCDFNADKPAVTGKPEIILDGWNVKDTKHNIFNSLIWGPDGWLYGCNGIQSQSKVGRPGTPDKDRVQLNCGVWRYHPIKKKFEVVCHGTTNPFGLDYDEYGEMFITNCVIHHLFHVIPGAHYDRMYGQDINPYSYGLMHSIADYIHWAGGDWTTSRGGKGAHSDAGGGHAHVGCMVYQGDNFPDEYRNTLFTCNLHGNRLNNDRLKRVGSGYKSERAPDFLFANDPWFRGIAVKSGPDGGVFITDWSDTGECHNYDRVDLTTGRIHKVTYGTPKAWKGDLSKLSIKELVALQSHKNDWFARHARRLLFERAVAGEREEIVKISRENYVSDDQVRLRLSWLLYAVGDRRGVRYVTLTGGNDAMSHACRAWGIRMTLEEIAEGTIRDVPPNAPVFDFRSPAERLALASGIQRLRLEDRLPWALRLLELVQGDDANDQNLPLMTWYAIEPLVGADRDSTYAVLKAARLPLVREYIVRKAVSLDPVYMGTALNFAVNGSDTKVARDMLQGIIDGLGGARQVPMPSDWIDAGPKLLRRSDGVVRERAMMLAVTFGDEKAVEAMKGTVVDDRNPAAVRSTALRVLLRRGKPDILPILQQLVDDKALRAEAIRGLAAFDDKQTPALLLKTYPTLSDAEKQDAVQTLASRPAWALALLDAIDAGKIPRKDVSAFVARQMQGLKDKRVGERLAKVWGTLQPASARRAELTAKYKAILTDDAMAKADKSHGRLMFQKNCASCHKLYDDGGDVGPGLTGSQRSNLDYLLENVLDPSAVVPNEYKMSVLQLQNGRTINGIITHETDKALTVRTANESIVVPKDEIETRTVSKLSLMPDGILEKLSETEVRDLIAYLRGKEQVPLPKP